MTTSASLRRLRLTSYAGSRIGWRLRAALALGVLALTLSVGAPAAYAAIITVNTTADELNSDGDCSLREAIQAANTNLPFDACPAGTGPDTIVVPAGTFTLSIAGAGEDANLTGDFDILGDLTMSGAGEAATIIDGADLDRVFHVVSGTVAMSGLTIQNGLVAGFGPVGSGGGVFNQGTLTFINSTISGNTSSGSFPGGGGIFNGGTLTLASSAVSNNNSAEYGGGIVNNDFSTLILTDSTVNGNTAAGGYGGGIANLNGTLTLNSSIVSDNSTGSHAGGILAGTTTFLNNSTVSGNSSGQSGGGILSFGTITLTNSTVSGNQGGGDGGGGIRSQSGILTITTSTVSGNVASSSYGQGGGILNDGSSTATITESTISGNSGNGGGGIANFAALDLTKSTLSGNSAPGYFGGGIRNESITPLDVINSTFSGNSAAEGGGIWNLGTLDLTHSTFSGNSAFSGGGIANSAGPVTLRNTIVANNGSGGNCHGGNVDGGGNLQHPGFDCGATIPSADPLLGPLQDNGGPTETMALPPGSPAVDTALVLWCQPTDQRGVARPQGAGCDIGAFELEITAPPCPPGDDDRDDDGLDDGREDLFGNLLNDADSDDDGIRDGNDDGDDDGEDDEDEDDGTDPCPEDGDGDGEDDEDEDDEEDD